MACALLSSSVALAPTPAPTEAEQAPVAVETTSAPGSEPPIAPDGPRFRFGIAAVGGLERVPDQQFGAWNVGMDLRLGVQLNDLIGIYAEPHFSGGNGCYDGGACGGTGIFSATAMVDFTLFDQLVLGAGVGYGLLENRNFEGVAVEMRAGYYPAVGRPNPMSPRRKGLLLGATFRTIINDVANGFQFTGSIGYEVF